jgi:hypothetical protein
MQSTFLYAPLIGGMYKKGGPGFNLTKPQTLAGTTFQPKYYEVNVTEYLEDIEVENKGPEAVFSLIDTDLRNAMHTMTEIVALAMQRHGQAVVTGVNAPSRDGHINGWVEALNDGITPGWDGNYFTTYGGATRNAVIGAALNSEPYFAGNPDGSTGPITFKVLEETYQSISIGRKEPDLGVGNKHVISLIKERLQPQQRFAQEKDPMFGLHGFRFNNAMILKDDLFPSTRYGQSRTTGSFLPANFTSPATTGTNSNMPTATTIVPGELFCWFNTGCWAVRISDSQRFGFGFTGFKPQIDGTRVAGQILAALNLQCFEPRVAGKQIFGIGA